MTKMIFVNLPVRDLKKSMDFFAALGFRFNPQFTDDTAACMIIADNIFAMLLTHAKFKMFTAKEIADTSRTVEVLTALNMDSKEEVHAFVDKAVAAGAKEPSGAKDYGFMVQRSFDDLDGHTWEIFWMDPAHVQQQG